jgi:membrane fusion protein, multidrug efflux system
MSKSLTHKRTSGRVVALACLALLPALVAGCEQKTAAAPVAPPPQVGVVTVHPQPVQRITELPGRTAAVMTAEVRPQVSGVILKRLFTEGGEVKEGQQLYQIDPATYQAAYDNAVATLAHDEAALADANAKVARFKPLAAAEAVSKQDYDDAAASAKEAQADIASARAAVEQARINLGYTKVLSPIAGRIGHSTVTPGALVTANQTLALATVTQLDPIYVDVNQPVTTLLRLRRELAAGEIETADHGAAKVRQARVRRGQRESRYRHGVGARDLPEPAAAAASRNVCARRDRRGRRPKRHPRAAASRLA